MLELLLVFAVAFAFTFITIPWIMPKLKRRGLTGKDRNKPSLPETPEMGGFGIIAGFSAGVLVAVALFTFPFFELNLNLGLITILAALSTILIMAIIGVIDDLFSINQLVKASIPLFAAMPLVAVKAGETTMALPFIGSIDFGIWYALLLIPIGIAGASNVTNMLEGFNGLGAGMGIVACTSLAFIAWKTGSHEALIILIAMIGALLAFFYYNFKGKIFMGDIGTLSIGAVIACSVIIGNFETAGVIVIIPYALDFIIKAKNRFPSSDWWGTYKDGKLTCPGKPVGLCQLIMKFTGGISEKNLVLSLIGIELIFGIIAVMIYGI